MKRVAWFLVSVVLMSLLGYLGVEAFIPVATAPPTSQEEVQSKSEPFPITTRFELDRDYGYFIGDVISLTLIVEARQGVVVDLVNLPQKGEQHGLFEIRDATITSSVHDDAVTIHRAAYRLQYFGAAPLAVEFEPLEILYALDSSRGAVAPTYQYQALFSQPLRINISRIGPYQPTKALDPKGPLTDKRLVLFWGTSILGTMCVIAAVGGWGRVWWRSRHPHVIACANGVETALQRLRHNEKALALDGDHRVAAATQLGHIMRDYIQGAWNVSAHTLTPTELAARLQGTPQVDDLLGLLQRCDACKYEPYTADKGDVHFLWEETVTLFENLD